MRKLPCHKRAGPDPASPQLEDQVEKLKKKSCLLGGVRSGIRGVVYGAIDAYRVIKGH
jgi:hypothetical protein